MIFFEKNKKSAEYLNAILNSVCPGILGVGDDGKIVTANKIFYEMWE